MRAAKSICATHVGNVLPSIISLNKDFKRIDKHQEEHAKLKNSCRHNIWWYLQAITITKVIYEGISRHPSRFFICNVEIIGYLNALMSFNMDVDS